MKICGKRPFGKEKEKVQRPRGGNVLYPIKNNKDTGIYEQGG